jgi:carboxymethylenebutenolidase
LQSYLPASEKSESTNGSETLMIDQQVEIPTRDGKTTTFITHPERGGPFPVIIFYMDAPAIREELRDMARRLAHLGLLCDAAQHVLPCWRHGARADHPDPESPERKRMFELMHSLSIPLVMEDTKALLAYAEGQKAANTKIVGTVGYCMSGRYAVNAATHFPISSRPPPRSMACSWRPTSPTVRILRHRRPRPSSISPAPRPTFMRRRSYRQGERRNEGHQNEVEVYPGTHHGFAFPKRPVYHRDAAERHWERLLALYRRNLGA